MAKRQQPKSAISHLALLVFIWLGSLGMGGPVGVLCGDELRTGQVAPFAGAWGPGDHDAPLQVHSTALDPEQKRSGSSSESWTLSLGQGSFAYLEHVLPHSLVVPQLSASVWLRSDRSPLRLRVRVVLPRGGSSGEPLATWVEGDAVYTAPHRWQQLKMDDLPLRLARQVRVLRLRYGPSVSPEGAYIDRLAVNVYAGPGKIRVWLDDVGLDGSTEVPDGASGSEVRLASNEAALVPEVASREAAVQLRGTLWMADGRPFFPRIADLRSQADDALDVTWQQIRARGWNTVWQDDSITRASFQEARRHSLWIIAPPPWREPSLLAIDGPAPILAWQVSGTPADASLPMSDASFSLLRRVAPESRRPLLAADDGAPTMPSGAMEVRELRRAVWGTTFELPRWPDWVATRRSESKSAPAPLLITLDASPSDSALKQLHRMGFQGPTPCIPFESLRQLTRWSIAAGANGIVCNLPPADADARSRERILDAWELLNIELELMEPWLAADQPRRTVRSSEGEIQYTILQTDRATLAVPLLPLQGTEHVPAAWTDKDLKVAIPCNSSAAVAYELIGDTLRPMRSKHGPGGLQVECTKFTPSQMILVTSEPIVVAHVRRQLAAQVDRRLELSARIFRYESRRVDDVVRQLGAWLPDRQTVVRWHRGATQLGAEADEARARGQTALAIQRYEMATAALGRGMQTGWHFLDESITEATSSPGVLLFETLPAYQMLLQRLESARLGAPLIAGGDMESLEQMKQAGWKHWQPDADGSHGPKTVVTMARDRPHQGEQSLRLESAAPASGAHPTLAWIQSPLVVAPSDGTVVFHGWLRMALPVQGPDGVLIFDSLAGPEMGLRYYEKTDWQEFSLYRFVRAGEPLQITVALTGPGQVDLDDVTLTTVEP